MSQISDDPAITRLIRATDHAARCDQMLRVCRFLRLNGFVKASDALMENLETLVEKKEEVA